MSDKKELTGRDLVDFVAGQLYSKKADALTLMDMKGLSDVADYYLVATCTSEAQMRAIITSMQRSLKKVGVKPLGVEYKSGNRWAVIDVAELIIHLFEDEHRTTVDIEKLWGDAKQEELKPENYTFDDEEEIEEEDDTYGYV
ncbi:MAG: ribosome silencing factor [Fibrobacterales bacterium]